MSLKGMKKEKRDEIRDKMLEFRSEAEIGNRRVFERMTLAERYKIGKQWHDEDVRFNEGHGKFAVTVNEILPIVLQVCGVEEQNPTDGVVRNVKDGTQTVASIITSLVKKVMDDSNGDKIKSQTFEQGNTVGRSFMWWDIDYTQDPERGNFVLKETDPFNVLPQPNIRVYDYNSPRNGAKYLIIDDWMDKGLVEATYPDEADQIRNANFNPHQTMFRKFSHLIANAFANFNRFGTRDSYRDQKFDEDADVSNKEKTNHRVSTYLHKEYKKGVYVKRLDDPLQAIALTKKKDISQAKRLAAQDENIVVIEKDGEGRPLVVPILNKTVMVGDILLDHIPDPYKGMNLFTLLRFAPYFDSGYEYCIVENLIGPQKIINFASSTLINIVKNLANNGWFTAKCSKKMRDWLAAHGSEDGIVLDKTLFGGSLEKIKSNDYPVGVDTLAERMKGNIRETSQIQSENPKPTSQSGKAKQIDELQSLRTMGVIFRNWKYFNVLQIQVLVELIRNTDVFSDEEILAVVEEDGLIDEAMLNEARQLVVQEFGIDLPQPPTPPDENLLLQLPPETQVLLINQFEEEQQVFVELMQAIDQEAIPLAEARMIDEIRNMQKGRYGVKVDLSPSSPTRRMAKRLEITALNESLIAGGNQGLGRKAIIDAWDIDNKEEAIAGVV